ncbi:MAG TPA: hypothetical protein VFH27_08365 [Longimicrobiaceae bacterium]|nr:hypothetical protein [Longimicrobiaceae bacterium]
MDGTATARGAGGTSGGMGTFLAGFILAAAGGYLFTSRVMVATSPWTLFGYNAFGLTLIPLLGGIFFLFFDRRSILGWLLTVGGLTIIGAGILMNLQVYFQPTSLFQTLLMLTMLAGGMGLVARSFLPR